jgi:hypothetical protein
MLDAMSVIELEELGIRRIVLTPEERPEMLIGGVNPAFIIGFLIDQEEGTLSGSMTLHPEPPEMQPKRVVSNIPAITNYMLGREQFVYDEDELSDEQVSIMPKVYWDATAAIELVILSAWRDLVVPEVRDQHYVIDRVRKGKGTGKRAAKRGNIEVIRYLPRRLVYRRESLAASHEGQRRIRQVHAVGTFSKLLPEGQHRSAEADAFAKEIGMPLAAHQTIVKPHYRGGTKEERELAEERDQLSIKKWKSWSAVDILRTRSAR